MKADVRPLVLSVVAAGVLSVGGLAWLARDVFGSQTTASSRPSLLELLEEVRQAPPSGAPRRAAPKPPTPLSWSSPLEQACPAVDQGLRRRLLAQWQALPRQSRRIATDPTNFGERFQRDAFGNRVDPTPRVVVLHETVYGLESAINTFLTPHPRDEDQVSYHTLIGQKGEVVQALDPVKRAFGAGNSAFNGLWVVTNPRVGGSINNFALHLSLETPLDGENEAASHSGYTSQQYDAMAVVLAEWMRRYRIPARHITTHRHVDLGGERADPRSFDWNELGGRLAALGLLC